MNELFFYLTKYGIYLLYGLLFFILLKHIFSKTLKTYHSRWYTLINNFEYSPKEFYKHLQVELESHGITKIKIKEEYIKEGGIMSHSRIYLRVTWKDYQYDICAAKFGKGYFISWWLFYKDSIWKILVSKIPFVGRWIALKLYPITYYRTDTASMFMLYVHASLIKTIDDITNNSGIRTLTEEQRKPILNDVFLR